MSKTLLNSANKFVVTIQNVSRTIGCRHRISATYCLVCENFKRVLNQFTTDVRNAREAHSLNKLIISYSYSSILDIVPYLAFKQNLTFFRILILVKTNPATESYSYPAWPFRGSIPWPAVSWYLHFIISCFKQFSY